MKGVVLEFWKRPDGEVLSTRGDLICLALFLATFVSASYDLMSESFRQGPCKGKKEKCCFFLLVTMSVHPGPCFCFVLFSKSALRLWR